MVEAEPLAQRFLRPKRRDEMSEVTSIQRETEAVESREETGSELARYMEQQTEPIRTSHKLLLAVELVGAILYIGLLVLAIWVSVTWKTHSELAIPRWWMASQVSAALLVVILGLHTLVVKAFLPIPYPNGKETIVTGRKAVRQGWMLVGLGPLWGAAWGGMYLFIVLSGAEPLDTFIPFVVILSIGVGVISGIVTAIQKWARSR
jgi:hypothetical protein